MALDLDPDVSRKITKYALVAYVVMFFISPVQPLAGSTLMGLAAIVPIMLGPNPMRILGLMAFALAGYFFWPEYQESKKLPTRMAVTEAVAAAAPLQAAVAAFVAKEKRLPAPGDLELKAPANARFAIEPLPSGAFTLRFNFAPIEGRSLRQTPVQNGDKITWQCVSDDLEQSYLPRQCRNAENLRKARALAK